MGSREIIAFWEPQIQSPNLEIMTGINKSVKDI